MAKKTGEPKFRKVEKVDNKCSAQSGKYYQIGETHSLKAERKLRIETLSEVTEHDGIDTLPVELKERQGKKDAKIKKAK